MSLNIVVLAKQVPDTRNVGPDAMTPEGTVNRSVRCPPSSTPTISTRWNRRCV
jgi:hypothetical protein